MGIERMGMQSLYEPIESCNVNSTVCKKKKGEKKQALNTGKTCQRRNLSLLKKMLKEQGRRISDYVVWLQDPQTIVLNLNGHILCKSSVFVCVLCLWNPHKWQKSFLYFFCCAPIIRNCAPGTSVERTCTLWHHKGHCYTQLCDSLRRLQAEG